MAWVIWAALFTAGLVTAYHQDHAWGLAFIIVANFVLIFWPHEKKENR